MRYQVNQLNRITRALAFASTSALLLIAGPLALPTAAQTYSSRPKATAFTQQSKNNAANTVFNGGRDLIDDAQWTKAEAAFAQYISAYPQEKNLDAAMYWMAYAQSKLKKFNQSKDTVQKLLKTYEKTVWKEDAELLMAQFPDASVAIKIDPVVAVEPVVAVSPVAIAVAQDPIRNQEMQERIAEATARAEERAREAQERAREGQERAREAQERVQERVKAAQELAKEISLGVGKGMGYGVGFGYEGPSDDNDPCEFKIVVLQALVESDPQRGLAVANDWLKTGSTQTPPCRRAALRVLARVGGKAALPTIMSSAQNDADAKVRLTAISLLGSSNDESVVSVLRDFALNSTTPEVGEAALYALGQHNSPAALSALADIALSTKPIALRKAAIRSISNRQGEPAVDALFKIYDSSQDLEIRTSVVSGFGNRKSERAGAKLREIASSSADVPLRKAAISAIGNRGGETAADVLMDLFATEKNEELKDRIMSSLANSRDKKVTMKLIEIAKNPQTPIERRRRAIQLLSSRGKDPDVIKYFEELLRQ